LPAQAFCIIFYGFLGFFIKFVALFIFYWVNLRDLFLQF